MVREDDEEDIAEVGGNVPTCKKLDVVQMDAFAFGFHLADVPPTGLGMCAAFNPCEHVYVVSQTGILPDFEIVPGLLKVSADAIGFSLKRGGLELTSANEMWNGQGDAEKLAVPGHFYLAGTGKIGMELSKYVKATFKMSTEMILDVDPNENGVFKPLGSKTVYDEDGEIEVIEGSQIPNIDLALLASGTQFADLALTTGKRDYVVSLSGLAKKQKDLYIKIDDTFVEAQYASGVEVSLQGLCDISDGLKPICKIFDGDSGISGRTNLFFNTEGDFGLMFKLKGKFALGGAADDVVEMFGGKDISFSGNAEVSMQLDDGRLKLCMNLNDGAFDECLGNCDADSDCDSDEFCNPITSLCRPKRSNGFFPCLADSQCNSGRCVDTTRTCAAKVNDGGTCISNKECKSGHCNGFLKCGEKKDVGENGWGPCARDSQCDSGRCVDTTRVCASKINNGGKCIANKECKSGHCNGFFKCGEKKSVGSNGWGPCARDSQCDSGRCVDTTRLCAAKTGNGGKCFVGKECASGYCKAFKCANKLGKGKFCTSGSQCSSGRCKWAKCK